MSSKRAADFSPLALAYLGDGVYELYVRERILRENENLPAYALHKSAVHYVSASAQSASMHAVEPMLDERETAVYKRGRNAKSPTVPKNADVGDYRRATGFEALLGFLYLEGEEERLSEIMNAAFETVKK